MADVVYNVEIRLGTSGHIASHFEAAHSKASMLHDVVGKIGEGMTGLAEKIEGVVEHFAKLAGAAGMGLAIYAVGHLNNELEQTKLSLAAIFNAQHFSRDFSDAMGMAGDQIAKMKQDVKTLPGDMGQLSAIMKTIATPAAQGGANADKIREMAGRGMLVGRILEVPPEVVARELANLLSGRAGAHNILGLRMGLAGDTAKEFNAKSASGRLAEIGKRFDAFAPAAEAFSHSFIANWTTLVDNVKYTILAPATSPLFESVKHAVIEINDYLDLHKQSVEEIASTVGRRLVDAWNAVEDAFKRIWPYIEKYGDILIHMQPAQMGHYLKQGGEALLGLRIGGMAMSGLGSAMSMGGQLSMMGGSGGIGAALSGLAEALPAIGTAALVAAPLIIAAGGALDILVDKTSTYHDEAVKNLDDAGKHFANTAKIMANTLEPLGTHARNALDWLGDKFLSALDAMAYGAEDAAKKVQFLAGVFDSYNYLSVKDQAAIDKFRASTDEGEHFDRDIQLPLFVAKGLKEIDKHAAKPGAGGGGGGTHIQKVEIVVSSNQDPARIARVVEARLAEIARHPRVSRSAPNWSQARIGHG